MARKSLILVIHKNERVRAEIAECLAQADYHVCRASGKHDGIPMLYQSHPDAVLVELGALPEEGWDILSHIRLFTEIPAIFIADNVHSFDLELGRKLGVSILVGRASQDLIERVDGCLHRLRDDPVLASYPLNTSELADRAKRPLRSISFAELRQVDRALDEVGGTGEVRLIKRKGRLCLIARVRTEPYQPVPV